MEYKNFESVKSALKERENTRILHRCAVCGRGWVNCKRPSPEDVCSADCRRILNETEPCG